MLRGYDQVELSEQTLEMNDDVLSLLEILTSSVFRCFKGKMIFYASTISGLYVFLDQT